MGAYITPLHTSTRIRTQAKEIKITPPPSRNACRVSPWGEDEEEGGGEGGGGEEEEEEEE